MTPRRIAIFALALLLGGAPLAAAADSAPALYNRALARERVLRDAARKPTLEQLRGAVAAYEAIVRRYPRSGYSDNALWQAGNLAAMAYERFGRAADRRGAIRLLTQIKTHYPSSSLAGRVDATLQMLDAPRSAARPAPQPASADPVVHAVLERTSEPDAAATAGAPIAIRGIKRTTLADGIRVVIEMDAESAYRSERLDSPARVFFDLKGTQPVAPLQDATLRFTDDVVREIRLGRHPQNTTRVVMDMEGVENYSVFELYDPYRLVIDFKAARAASRPASISTAPVPPVSAAVAPALSVTTDSPPVEAPKAADVVKPEPPPPTPARTPTIEPKPLPARAVVPPSLSAPSLPSATIDGKFSLARQLGLGISRVVIDAGHGGHDPGAQANGLKEAELVLDVAQRLAKLLQKQTAIEVVMTRDSDEFIPLEERTAIANREGADLFLSIHANAARNLQARGIETYFLNFATNPEAEAVAARENSASARKMHSLPDIVRAIALNNKIDESRHFADTVQRAMVQRLGARNKQLRNLGVKQAPFVVLIGAAMPSVLAEISFLTNRQEASLLKTGAYRQQIAEALFDSVLRYQQSLKRLKTAPKTVGAR